MTYRFQMLLVSLLLILVPTAIPVTAGPSDGSFEEVDAYIQETMRRLPIRGVSLAIVRDDQILYLQGYGIANEAGDRVTPQTPFMLASVTKTFTALAVQQLATEGKLDIDDTLQTYIPEFRLADAHATATMTIRHLLEHTSGISEQEGTQPYLHSPQTTFAQALNRLTRYKSVAAPGTQYEYSNWNYVLLGEVIARASGQSYTDYMQAHVLDPLDMTNASFADYHTLPHPATGNLIVFGARLPYDEKHIPVMLSAGYLTASAEDMAHYLIPFFNGGQYRNQTLLPVEGQGWFDAIWQWHPGQPGDIGYAYSGGHNSVNTAIQLFSLHEVGVAVLMNTRLDALLPGPSASQIAFNIARLVSGFSYEVPSNKGFYRGYAMLDGWLLMLCAAIGWQAFQCRSQKTQVTAVGKRKRMKSWLLIILDCMFSLGILVLPWLSGTGWKFMLYHRPETSIPLLVISLCLGILGLSAGVRAWRST